MSEPYLIRAYRLGSESSSERVRSVWVEDQQADGSAELALVLQEEKPPIQDWLESAEEWLSIANNTAPRQDLQRIELPLEEEETEAQTTPGWFVNPVDQTQPAIPVFLTPQPEVQKPIVIPAPSDHVERLSPGELAWPDWLQPLTEPTQEAPLDEEPVIDLVHVKEAKRTNTPSGALTAPELAETAPYPPAPQVHRMRPAQPLKAAPLLAAECATGASAATQTWRPLLAMPEASSELKQALSRAQQGLWMGFWALGMFSLGHWLWGLLFL